MRNALHIRLNRLASDRWARRGVRILMRSVWLGLSLCCMGLGVNLFFDISLQWQWLAAAALTCVAGGALLVLHPRMSTKEVARRLDRQFQLNEQIATALELGTNPSGLEVYLLNQSQHSVSQIQHAIARKQKFPWNEVALIAALLVILGGLVLLQGISTTNQLATPERLPPLVQAQDPSEQFADEPFSAPDGQQAGSEAASEPGAADPAALEAIADALRDQSVTRQVAEALDQGNLSSAAQSLRELADQAGQISPQARSELGESLQRAASQLDANNPGLAQQLRNSADGLMSGNDTQAAQAFEDLAGTVEQMGTGQTAQEGSGQQTGTTQGTGTIPGSDQQSQGSGGAGNARLPNEQRTQPSERLGVDGVPLELESEGDGTTPTQGQADDAAEGSSNSGNFSQDGPSPSTDPVQAADDPLRIPADLRDVVQNYFSP